MKIIGLCGGSGSGKGTVANIFLKYGIPSVDTDAVYHEITSCESDCLRELREEFGESIIENGKLDRKALSKIVFFSENSEAKRNTLNKIAHKHILIETKRKLQEYEKAGVKAALIDAPLLFESGFNKLCSSVICVIADENIRIERIMSRDNIDYSNALKRIKSQISNEVLIEKSDFVINNSTTLAELETEVSKVANQILINK